MTPQEYQEKAETTLVTKGMRDTLNMCALGLAGESGELIDMIKKMLFHHGNTYQGIFDIESEKWERLQSEIGDSLWYLTNIATALNMSLEDIMQHNIDKLAKRHKANGETTGFNPHYTSDSVKS